MTLLGLRLPLTWVVERTVRYDTEERTRDVSQARQEGEAQLLRELKELLGEDGSVVNTRFAAKEQNGCLLVTLRAECTEQIGQRVILPAKNEE